MCLVSVCPKGTEKNIDKIKDFIKAGFESNRDGSGYMFKRNGENTITVKKGFFDDVSKLIEAIDSEKLNKDDELVIHHRIGTSGRVTQENCHPFVISNNHDEIKATNITVNKPCLVHNGYFNSISNFMSENPDFSDTYAFTRYILGNKDIYNLFSTDIVLFNLLSKGIIGSSKVCVLFPDRDMVMLGDFIERESYYHSNHGYYSYIRDIGGSSTKYNKTNYNNYNTSYRNNSNTKYLDLRRDKSEFSEGFTTRNLNNNVLDESTGKVFYDSSNNFIIKPVILNAYIDYLDHFNYTHFLFIKNEDWVDGQDTRYLDLHTIPQEFSIGSNSITLHRHDGNINIWTPVAYNRILKDYRIIPKEDYKKSYIGYIFLRNSVKDSDIGKQTLKKVELLLTKNGKKSHEDMISYDKVKGHKFTKLSILLWKDYISNLYKNRKSENLIIDSYDNSTTYNDEEKRLLLLE